MNRTCKYYIFLLFSFIFTQHLFGDATIEGVVRDAATGFPISGVRVDAIRGNKVRYTATTDASGMYSLANIEPSNYTLVFSASGYQSKAIGVKPQNNQVTTVNIEIIPNGGTIVGTVINVTTLAPIAGATVNIFQGTQLITTTITDGLGEYSVPNLAPGIYILLVQATGFRSQLEGAFVGAGQSTTVDFALALLPGAIGGTVTDAFTTNPIEGALVEVYEDNVLIGFTDTDVAGNYTISGLPPGTYSVVASAENYQSASEGAIVIASLTTTVDFALQPLPGTIEGKVTNAQTGESISSAQISIFQRFTLIASLLTDQNGNYSLSGFAPGTYIVIANAQNFSIAASGAEVFGNMTTTENFLLTPNPGTISGTVIDATTTDPIAGAIIGVFDGPLLVANTVTQGNGNYQISNVSPGSYVTTALAVNYRIHAKTSTISSNQNTITNFSLIADPGFLEGIIIDAVTTDPIANATIAVFQENTFIASALSGSNGNYGISDLAPGNYIVVVIADGYQAAFSLENMQANIVTISDFALEQVPGAIAGTITNACQGDPLQGALIIVTDDIAIVGFSVSSMTGEYVINDLAPGTYLVTVARANFLPTTAIVIVTEDDTTILNFSLIPRALPPLDVTKSFIKNCYFTQTEWLPIISWDPNPASSCVTGYYIFRDGRRLAFVPSSILRYIDRRACKKTSSYSVQAVNSFGQTSVIIAS